MMVMDRGIVTGENLRLMEEKGYAYTVVERREREKDYPLEWEEGFTLIGEEANGVYVKRVEEEGNARVFCVSVRRREKEQGMDRLQEKRFLEALERLVSLHCPVLYGYDRDDPGRKRNAIPALGS